MFKQLLAVFLDRPCLLCDRPTKDLICIYCQRKLVNERWNRPQELWRGDLPVFAWGKYNGQLKRTITNIKYNNQPELGILLGRWLGNYWLDCGLLKTKSNISIIPIPIHQAKLKTRGFNQTVKIARGFCEVTGYTCNYKGLIRVKETEAMFGLNPLQRQKNIKNAFKLGDKLPRSLVILLDDIYTTEATVKEAANILRQAKIQVCGVVVLAKTNSISD